MRATIRSRCVFEGTRREGEDDVDDAALPLQQPLAASGPAELARAALESVGYQTRDLLEAMRADWAATGAGNEGEGDAPTLRVDGGMSASDWAMQFLADILGAPVDRAEVQETTALGAAWLAGMRAGLCPGMEGFAESWRRERRFEPAMPADLRDARYARWQRAVKATMVV